MQLSNVCFAAGQIFYRRWKINHPEVVERRVFGFLLAGAVLATLPTALPAVGMVVAITGPQGLTLAYLGLISSGLCFFLWNFGAARTGTGTLAVANNLKIPLAVACSLVVFGENADVVRLTIGGVLVVAAGLLAEWSVRKDGNAATDE
jgi:drug/metabolite transporter (DMT)-like permease